MLAARRSLVRTLTSSARLQAVDYRRAALDALAAVSGQVVLVDLLHTRPGSWDEHYARHLRSCSRLVADLRPRPDASAAVLLGDAEHAFDRILVSEHISGAAACDALLSVDELIGPRTVGAGSLALVGQRSTAFAGLSTFAGRSPPVRSPLRQWSDCPFAREADARPDAWSALESVAEPHMYAFNLIRTPDPALYRTYAAHFAHLPAEYGMRFVEAAALQRRASVVACDAGLSEERLEAAAAFDLMALVYFPSSRCFVDAWSDPALVRDAIPTRARLLEGGLKHVWLRCADDT